MPYDSRVYNILIASPSDVAEEREIAVSVIQAWNNLSSFARKVVLLPVRWETHTAPDYGKRPQAVINQEIVDNCDLLIGMFWTRVGTPTDEADSGTLEEITRVAKAGKPVMLYFSKVGMDPDLIDMDQLARLKKFKAETYQHALVETYKSHLDFRDKLTTHLERKVRELQSADGAGRPQPLVLSLSAAGGAPSSLLKHSVEFPTVTDWDQAIQQDKPEIAKKIRDAAQEGALGATSTFVTLQISNNGLSGIRNLFVKVAVLPSSPDVFVADPAATLESLWRTRRPGSSPLLGTLWALPYLMPPAISPAMFSMPSAEDSEEPGLVKHEESWTFSFEWDALQPSRVRPIKPRLVVRSRSSAKVTFVATVYADSFPEPVKLEATLDLTVRPKPLTLRELLPNLDALRTPPAPPPSAAPKPPA